MESILEQPKAPLPPSKQYNATNLHLLPCGIQHDGRANIPSFFFLVDGQYPDGTQPQEESTNETKATATTTEELAGSAAESATLTPETSFRGRTLKGTIVKVPQGYTGSIYQAVETQEPVSDYNNMDMSIDMRNNDDDEAYEAMLRGMQEQRKTLKTEGRFSEFTLWGHDQAPTLKNDKLLKAMQWVDIATVLHASV